MATPLIHMCASVSAATKNWALIGIALSLIFTLQSNLLWAQTVSSSSDNRPTPSATARPSALLIDSGRAMFRVEEQIYFDRDLIALIDQVNAFSCAFAHSQLQDLLSWDLGQMKQLKAQVRVGGPPQQSELDQLFPAVLAVKLAISVKGNAVVVLAETKKLFFQSLRDHKCWEGEGEVPEAALLSWLESEVFLRARFSGEAQSDQDQVKARREALRASWQAQYPHQIFYSLEDHEKN